MGRPKKKYSKRALIVKKHLIHGDILRIEMLTGFSQKYVLDVMAARRYNGQILSAAINIAKENRRLRRIAKLRNELKTINQ